MRDPGLRVVFVSGYPADAIADGLLDGDAVLLSKPYDRRDLAEALRDLLDQPA